MPPFEDESPGLRRSLQRWTRIHALVMVPAAFAVLTTGADLLLPGLALVSFGVLLGLARRRWTPDGSFGLANGITVIRLFLSMGLWTLGTSVSPAWVVPGAILVLVLDGLDGRVARERGEVSSLGELFDMEVDAFFVLILSLLLAELDRLGSWIATAGLLRYAFVLWTWWVQPMGGRERRSRLARISFVVAVAVLLTAFLPLPALYRPLAVAATALLVVSFARSAWFLLERT